MLLSLANYRVGNGLGCDATTGRVPDCRESNGAPRPPYRPSRAFVMRAAYWLVFAFLPPFSAIAGEWEAVN
jgi:hypothetical protein